MLKLMSQTLISDPILILAVDCCSVQRRLCFAWLPLFYFRLCNYSFICVSIISMLCSGKCPHGAVLTEFFFKSCRLVIGAIRVSENLGKLCCITLVTKKLNLHVTLRGFLKHMCACSWTHTKLLPAFQFSTPTCLFCSLSDQFFGEVALIIASQQVRSELAELKKKTKIGKVFDMGLWQQALCSGVKVSCIENVTWMSGIVFQAAEGYLIWLWAWAGDQNFKLGYCWS